MPAGVSGVGVTDTLAIFGLLVLLRAVPSMPKKWSATLEKSPIFEDSIIHFKSNDSY